MLAQEVDSETDWMYTVNKEQEPSLEAVVQICHSKDETAAEEEESFVRKECS